MDKEKRGRQLTNPIPLDGRVTVTLPQDRLLAIQSVALDRAEESGREKLNRSDAVNYIIFDWMRKTGYQVRPELAELLPEAV